MWSLISLTAAFIDLAIAYFLLSASALAFFASKFLSLLGLSLPCPCHVLFFSDIYGGSSSLCLNRLLVDFPAQKVSDVLLRVEKAYPFNGCTCNTASNRVILRADCDASCSNSFPEDWSNLTVRAEEYDVKKGKGIVLSRRRRTRRRVRGRASAVEALQIELEKERSASATAAEEAMSMILRLQEEKAVIEMESKQYQRLMEEKSAHYAEEISLLKEILVKREREKLFLETEVEAYRQMIALADGDYDEKLFSGDALDEVGQFVSRGPEEGELATRIGSSGAEGDEEDKSPSPEEKIIVACDGIQLNKPYGDNDEDYGPPIKTSVMESLTTVTNDARTGKKASEANNYGLQPPPTGPNTLSLLTELRRSCSMSRADREMLSTDAEVERLIEKLKLAREDREKLLGLPIQERRDMRAKSLDDKSQVLTKKRRCRSVSSGLWTTLKSSLNTDSSA